MALVVVNPRRKRRKAKAPVKRNPATHRAKKGVRMARKHRSAAQKAAFRRMIAHNPHRRRRRATSAHTVSNPRRRVVHRRRVHNPVRNYRHYRRHRNPSSGGFFGGMLGKSGLLLLGAVVATPTLMAEAQSLIFPNATGYYQAGIQGAVGVAAGYLVYRFLDQQTGRVVAAIGMGTAVAQLISAYNAGTLSASKLSGMGAVMAPSRRYAPGSAGGRIPGARVGARPMLGYTSQVPQNDGNLGSYVQSPTFRAPAEPGMRRIG